MRDAADASRGRATGRPSSLDLPDALGLGDDEDLDAVQSPSAMPPRQRSHSDHGQLPTPQPMQRFSSMLPFEALSGEEGRSAEAVLNAVVPGHSTAVKARLRRENVATAGDLARLDKEDLRELGLSMVERGKVLAWARQSCPPSSGGTTEAAKMRLSALGSLPVNFPGTPGANSILRKTSQMPEMSAMIRHSSDASGIAGLSSLVDRDKGIGELLQEQDVLTAADFWCRLAMDSGTSYLRADVEQVDELLKKGGEVTLGDLRENVLEKLFDLSPERVKEIYESIDKDSDGRILKDELREGLHRCELHGLDGALEKVLAYVGRDRGSLELSEFESVLSRLKLAQLLSAPKLQHPSAAESLAVIDYNSLRVEERRASLKDFFFGRRNDAYPMRWVHLRQFDLTLMLSLTVKYQLHPLSVEDVIDQAPTKIDHYEGHYFVSIEHLEVLGQPHGMEPVHVRGRHVSLFCAGAPLSDTVLSVSQADRSFQQDWPSLWGQAEGLNSQEDNWIGRLHKRIRAVRSRVRERRADFLMYEIIDLCTDDLRVVTRAYTARLNVLEDQLQRNRLNSENEKLQWFNEVGVVRLQLAVVARRLRGLQRILRRLTEDPDISPALCGYLQDVGDHVNEAYEDAGHLGEKCSTLSAAYEHAEDRAQDKIYQETAQAQTLQDERMNKMLFILTMLSTVFTPLTFVVGVYGMNFQDGNGHPTIPELLVPDGYMYFLVFTAVYLLIAGVVSVWLWRRVRRGKRHHHPVEQVPAIPGRQLPARPPGNSWGASTPVNSNYSAMP